MKLCINCQHYSKQEMMEVTGRTDYFKNFHYTENRCYSPNIEPNYVTGAPKFRFCEENRERKTIVGLNCGGDGLWYEEKEEY